LESEKGETMDSRTESAPRKPYDPSSDDQPIQGHVPDELTYPPQESAMRSRFTRRERQILQLVAKGMDNREIGSKLHIAEQTVKNHLHLIFRKAGVSHRWELSVDLSSNESLVE
jgi:DNA-binding NarL/FixJ family response regulator